ncbi:maestro heat-like repeat-containing protein family member 7 [Zonotrichia albicollis]|uniref:maestro heat-like repeat-containing protein family member 7 n=1 Tax=Zonotrichia albicollis TaxID=44394 RepID=UPI003D80FB61
MPPARPRPPAGLPRARTRLSRRGLASARLWPYWRWRCWAGVSAWCEGGIAALRLRLARARPRTRRRVHSRPRPRLLPGPAEDTRGAAASAASAAASPARAPPLGSAAAGPEPPVPRSRERTPGHGRPGAGEGRSGAVAGPGPSVDRRVPPAGKAQEARQERHRLRSVLGRQRASRVPKLATVEEEEKGPGAAPAEENEEAVPFHPPQEDAPLERTQEQERTRGLFQRTAQMVAKFMKRIREEETSIMGTVVRVYPPIFKTNTSAALLDMLVEEGPSSPKQVPAMVRYIHQWFMANEFPEYNLHRPLLDLTEAQPADVVMALLRVAPSCDRAALTMWKTIMCSCRTAETAMLVLLDVLANWPEHSTCTSDGDHTAVLALAATVVMWKILQMPCVPHVVTMHFPHLFVYLLFQVLFSTLDMPEAADTFWKGCQQQHCLATSPNSFAEQTLKALLCRLHYEDVVVAMKDKHGWDTLLCADTHHCAVGMLAREMHRASEALCSVTAFHLLGLLSKDTPCWDLAAMAFLVETLDCLDLSECRDSILEVMSKKLQSECREMRRLALRGLLVLGTSVSAAIRMWSLDERLVELLQENDSNMLRMTVVLLSRLFLCNGALLATPIALQLAGALLPLFDNDDSQVQVCSMFIFREMLYFWPEEEKKALKSPVHQSLLPLFFHCHDENQRVAEDSWETLHCSATFLHRKDLQHMLQLDQTWRFGKALLAEDRSRAAEHLRRALRYVESPQEPLREAAIRFMGMAGRRLRGQQQELQLICTALERLTKDRSSAVSQLALKTLHVLLAIQRQRYSTIQRLQDQLRRAWRTRPRLSGLGCLLCRKT